MRGPLTFKIKMPGDPLRNFPVKAIIEVKRGEVKLEDVHRISNFIHQEGAHLALILTDHTPSFEVMEELESIPQIVLRVVEHRDLVKLFVISLAKQRGIDIDKNLLSRAYASMFEKIGLREGIMRWFEQMTKKGYLLNFEAFVDETVKACRFFINCSGEKYVSLEECFQQSWDIRNLLPYGIVSEIIPDMSLGALKNHVKVLKDCGFLEEEQGKYRIKRHPSEERVIEILERYGGSTSKSTLMRHFIFREAMERIFDSLLEHMERKMLIAYEHNTIRLIKLHDVRRRREEFINKFQQCKREIHVSSALPFAIILTWKENKWNLIPLESMEEVIEKLLEEVSLATSEEEIRSRTFLIEELVKWYETYTEIILLSKNKADETVRLLERKVGDIEQRCNIILDKLVKSMRIAGLQIELSEIQKLKSKLNEIKQFVESREERDYLEKVLEPLVGGKRIEREIRKEKLASDIDEEMEKRKIRGDWTIAKYLLLKKEEYDMLNEINVLEKMLISLETLLGELETIVKEMSNLSRVV